MTNSQLTLRTVRKVFVVVKQSEYAQAMTKADPRLVALVQDSNVATVGTMSAHLEHEETVRQVLDYLEHSGLDVTIASCTTVPASIKGFDLVLSVGGDGTFLTAACACLDTPILGIRSSVASVAHFCLADRSTFVTHLKGILAGTLQPAALLRLEARLKKVVVADGKVTFVDHVVDFPVLNDVLVHNANPAETTRYIIETGGKTEWQDSSGVYIGTPAGCTGALRSAGGKRLDVTARQFEFVVREPYIRPGKGLYALMRGLLDEKSEISIVSRMNNGKVFVDGPHRTQEFNFGDRLTLRRHPHDLIAFIDERVNDRYEFELGVYKPW